MEGNVLRLRTHIGFKIYSPILLERLKLINKFKSQCTHSRFTHWSWRIFKVSMLLSCLRQEEDYLMFSRRLCSSSKTQTLIRHWSKSVSAAIFSRTKGGKCVLLFVKQPHESFLVVCLCVQWFQGTSVFYLHCSDMVVLDSFWHVLRWHWDEEKGYGADWFIQGHCETPGIHVDSFSPDIMCLLRL